MLTRFCWIIATLVYFAHTAAAADERANGEAIYRQRCISCHGPNGAGTKAHTAPLVGDRSVLELAQVIAKTMPEDKPGTCIGDDARQVALYIHEAFYSPTAQARHAPARIELSRLTVGQYQQTVADLLDGFVNPKAKRGPLTNERGLQAEYFKVGRFNHGDRLIQRIDPTVNFDFGDAAPLEGIEPHEFAIRWHGSLLAPETGDYEFSVRSEHVAKLWVNDLREPLIDAGVKSGSDIVYRGSLRLIRGRAYPLRLEYTKKKLGVQKKDAQPPAVRSSITLKWKAPQREEEVIPQPYLLPQQAAQVFVVQTLFPPDDRSRGYERGTSISKAWDQATTDAAIEVATFVTTHVEPLNQTDTQSPEYRRNVQMFCHRFAERAFRRPLTIEQKNLYVDMQFDAATDPRASAKQVVLLVMKSPRFLYHEISGSSGDVYDAAARLSFGLWDSLPDQELLKAAATGKLATRAELTSQAERMLGDPRAHSKLREFFMRWLKLDLAPDLAKDAKQFPGFSPEIAADLRTSLELFIDEVLLSPGADFRKLLLSDSLPLNGRLAEFYGVNVPADAAIQVTTTQATAVQSATFQSIALGEQRAAGVLTHPYLLASLAYGDTSSPIHRGVLISRSMLGRVLRPPPDAVQPLSPDVHPGLTTRERIALQTKADACSSCHTMINPLGFTLENYDAVGRFRTEERGKRIDASGQYLTQAGQVVRFEGVKDLAQFLATNRESRAAFVAQFFHHLVKQPIRAYGPNQLVELQQSFEQQQCNITKLAAEIVVSAALTRSKKE